MRNLRRSSALLSLALIACARSVSPSCPCPPPQSGSSEPLPSEISHEVLAVGASFPAVPEEDVVGPATRVIRRDSQEFNELVFSSLAVVDYRRDASYGTPEAVHYMVQDAATPLAVLAQLVSERWPGQRLQVLEAWDDMGYHGSISAHYEGRSLELSVSGGRFEQLPELARLALRAGYPWVGRISESRLRVSVKSGRASANDPLDASAQVTDDRITALAYELVYLAKDVSSAVSSPPPIASSLQYGWFTRDKSPPNPITGKYTYVPYVPALPTDPPIPRTLRVQVDGVPLELSAEAVLARMRDSIDAIKGRLVSARTERVYGRGSDEEVSAALNAAAAFTSPRLPPTVPDGLGLIGATIAGATGGEYYVSKR